MKTLIPGCFYTVKAGRFKGVFFGALENLRKATAKEELEYRRRVD
jgi:hypothetical protein